MKTKNLSLSFIALASTVSFLSFQNCTTAVNFDQKSNSGAAAPDASAGGTLGVCDGISCALDPLTSKPAVTTILLALGDEADNQLVVNGSSSQLIAETVVRYTSPKANPKILLVVDNGSGKEDPEDTSFVADVLLARYDVTELRASKTGLTPEDLAGYDIVWLNNPGAPMGSVGTRDALLNFAGGVILQGDDLSRGGNFSLEELTGLKYIDNGTSVKCEDGKNYAHDNNAGNQYRVTLDASKIPGAKASTIEFRYGNDIDNTSIARADLEILATAKGGPEVCTADRPTIVRYLKPTLTVAQAR